MAVCPNCGRQTMRTADWACQWCGYPLLSGSYKKIDKTFKELQEERKEAWRSVTPEPEPEFEFESEAGEAPAPEPAPQPKRPPRPEPAPEFKRPPEPEPEPEPEPGPELELKPEPEQPAPPEPEDSRPPEVLPEPIVPPAQTLPAPPAQAELQPPTEPAATPEPEPEPEPAPAPEPEPEPEPVVSTIKLEDIKDGMMFTIDELDALFRGDKAMLNARLADKTILVKGNVSKVFIRDHIDVRYILLTGSRPRMVWSARCGFGPSELAKMSRLNESETVTIRGKYDGYSKNIILKDCTLAD
jgi:hypothetical protein